MNAEHVFVVLCWILALLVGVIIGEKLRKHRLEKRGKDQHQQGRNSNSRNSRGGMHR